jgi:nicotinamidase-related amidase
MHMLQASLPGAQRLLAAARAAGLLVVHTLEAHRPDLSGEGASKAA